MDSLGAQYLQHGKLLDSPGAQMVKKYDIIKMKPIKMKPTHQTELKDVNV